MLECQVHGAQDLRVRDVPMPRPGPGEVLVRLGAAGICGSDMHYYFHGRVGQFVIREPLTPGHEASGVVAALGDGVRDCPRVSRSRSTRRGPAAAAQPAARAAKTCAARCVSWAAPACSRTCRESFASTS